MSYDKSAEDFVTNQSDNPHIEAIIEARLADPARRNVLAGGAGAAALSIFGLGSAVGLAGCKSDSKSQPEVATPTVRAVERAATLGFAAIPKSTADVLTVPVGYTASVLFRLGDPMSDTTPDYRNDGSESGASFNMRAGDHHDGMHFFGLSASGAYDPNASDRGLLCMNHEALTPAYLHANGVTTAGGVRMSADECIKEMNAMGVSVVEVRRSANNTWSYVRNSAFNRRLTTATEMQIVGPAAGSKLLITRFSPTGVATRGTLNNCANGYTPWGTYLTCEENFAGYFRRVAANDNPNRSAKELTALARYGVAGTGREGWSTATAASDSDTIFSRWIAEKTGVSADGSDDFRNAANTFGWVVEIDPFNPSSAAKKRTAMGRFAHEGAWLGRVAAGKPIVYYMGCDSRNEYIYKYVSTALWDPADATRGASGGDKYLNDGKLYVARFNADATGDWIELRFGNLGVTASNTAYAFENQADVLINLRLAADAVIATKMDRPEWGAVDPFNGTVYMTLTNNSQRTVAATDAANPRYYNDPRTTGTAQRGNPNGHIIRWIEAGFDSASPSFVWDIFLFGSRAASDPRAVNLSGLTAANDFSSPDGLWFGRNGILWIQTDDGAYTDVTNCMMLAAIPGTTRDGVAITVANTDGTNSKSVNTYIGAPLGETKLRRFLVGPKECEITGLAESPDGRSLFVNIQHPGEDTVPNFGTSTYGSNWPDGGRSRPRSATIVITRNDGGVIGI
jgi:uncharacterized protein